MDDQPLISSDKMDLFHHIVAKLLFVSKRARVDINLTVSFLCTRVSCSTNQDWEKLQRLLSYLMSSRDMPRVIGANGLEVLQTWVDALYTIHLDMKGHTGGVMSMGRGVIQGKASKQKLNTKSSTESEVVGASDYMVASNSHENPTQQKSEQAQKERNRAGYPKISINGKETA